MITLYKGARGRGKTLTMVKDAFNYYNRGYRVISNFYINFGEFIDPEEVLNLNKDSNLFNAVLVVDEVQIFFDSRNFGKKHNKDFSNFLQQIRKRNIKILFTTQYLNTVDLRLRQHIDVVAFPKYNESLKVCHVRYFDITSLEDDVSGSLVASGEVIFNAQEVFGLYDTYQMLK